LAPHWLVVLDTVIFEGQLMSGDELMMILVPLSVPTPAKLLEVIRIRYPVPDGVDIGITAGMVPLKLVEVIEPIFIGEVKSPEALDN
jgi:hypothetical protein